jgi:hypothetical protein
VGVTLAKIIGCVGEPVHAANAGASLAWPRQARPLYHFIPACWLQKIFPRHYQRCKGRLERDKAKGFEWVVMAKDASVAMAVFIVGTGAPTHHTIPPTSTARSVCSYSFFLTKSYQRRNLI